jgi:hypothetical protein
MKVMNRIDEYRPISRSELGSLPDGTLLKSGWTGITYEKTGCFLRSPTRHLIRISTAQQRAWRMLEEPSNDEKELWV